MNVSAPEEIELDKKRRVLERLKDKLAFREEAMTELRAELEQFEANYIMEVGRLYADLDEIEAQIAEEEVKLVPDDEEIKNVPKNCAAAPKNQPPTLKVPKDVRSNGSRPPKRKRRITIWRKLFIPI